MRDNVNSPASPREGVHTPVPQPVPRPAGAAGLALVREVLLPGLFYFLCYAVLFYPVLTQFSSRFFCDQGDGMQNVFNLWWVNKAVTQLHQSPWQTHYLQYPWGTTLLGHTLNPFNGFLCVLLLKFLTLVQAFNFIVVFSFVVGGLTAFWLCHDVTGSRAGSLAGGFLFTFSSFHCANAIGHLQLVSLEWLPLVPLVWRRYLRQPTVPLALGASAALLANILCDYYYFFYSVSLVCLMTAWEMWQRRDALLIVRRPYWTSLAAFLAATAATSGILVFSLLHYNRVDPLLGSHDAATFSTNVLSLFVPSGVWRFAGLTNSFRARWITHAGENEVYLGYSVLVLAISAFAQRKRLAERQDIVFWSLIGLLFLALSLGPVLHIANGSHPHPLGLRLPYHILERLLPMLSISGVPVRMMVITYLAAAVLASAGIGLMLRRSPASRALAAVLLVLLVVEYLPASQITSPAQVPGFVDFLKTQPDGAVLDTLAVTDQDPRYFTSVYYVAVEDRPMAFGYTSRTATSTEEKDQKLSACLRSRDYPALYRDYRIRYLVTGPGDSQSFAALYREYDALYHREGITNPSHNVYSPPTPAIYQDGSACIYDLTKLK